MDQTMAYISFRPFISDPNVWMKENANPDGSEYWEFFIYFYDVSAFSHVLEKFMDVLDKTYKLKEDHLAKK